MNFLECFLKSKLRFILDKFDGTPKDFFGICSPPRLLRRCPSEIEDMRSRAALLHPTLHTAATYISTQQIMQFGPQIESVRSRVDVLSIPKLLLQPLFPALEATWRAAGKQGSRNLVLLLVRIELLRQWDSEIFVPLELV